MGLSLGERVCCTAKRPGLFRHAGVTHLSAKVLSKLDGSWAPGATVLPATTFYSSCYSAARFINRFGRANWNCGVQLGLTRSPRWQTGCMRKGKPLLSAISQLSIISSSSQCPQAAHTPIKDGLRSGWLLLPSEACLGTATQPGDAQSCSVYHKPAAGGWPWLPLPPPTVSHCRPPACRLHV